MAATDDVERHSMQAIAESSTIRESSNDFHCLAHNVGQAERAPVGPQHKMSHRTFWQRNDQVLIHVLVLIRRKAALRSGASI